MSSETQTSFGIEDLINTPEENEFVSQPAVLATGAEGNFEPDMADDEVENPDATRWMFNPYAFIDLTNLPNGCGFSYLRNIVFNRVRTLTVNIGKDVTRTTRSSPLGSHSADNYDRFKRTSHMIATELEARYGDKGVILIPELTGFEEEAAEMNKLLFGDEIEAKEDINVEGHPVPVLPNILEQLQANANKAIAEAAPEDKAVITAVARRVRDSVRLAIRHARTVIDEAQKRFLDEKNPNRWFSTVEKRAYLALGEEIPNQLPVLTKSAAAGMGGVSGQAVVDAVVAGVMAAKSGEAAVPAPPATPSDFVDVDKAKDLEAKAAAMDFGDAKPKTKTPSAKIATGAKKDDKAETE